MAGPRISHKKPQLRSSEGAPDTGQSKKKESYFSKLKERILKSMGGLRRAPNSKGGQPKSPLKIQPVNLGKEEGEKDMNPSEKSKHSLMTSKGLEFKKTAIGETPGEATSQDSRLKEKILALPGSDSDSLSSDAEDLPPPLKEASKADELEDALKDYELDQLDDPDELIEEILNGETDSDSSSQASGFSYRYKNFLVPSGHRI
ncbi:hypothetical protein [Microbulbifer sp. JMSA003]|uniref:hypothetical protein n=1 Tax=Microbulbifer sp. JMSA003 TaxID=3243369 RepID=UPI004039D89F